MSRLVSLYFEDNEDADRFVEGVESGQIWISDAPAPRGKVTGLFAVPTKFCECTKEESEQGGKRIARGGRLGWWVHRKCGKPLTNSWQSPNNLLPEEMKSRDPWVQVNWTFKFGLGLLPDTPRPFVDGPGVSERSTPNVDKGSMSSSRGVTAVEARNLGME